MEKKRCEKKVECEKRGEMWKKSVWKKMKNTICRKNRKHGMRKVKCEQKGERKVKCWKKVESEKIGEKVEME